MDTKLTMGDFSQQPNGQTCQVTGAERLVQQALIALTVPLGSFPYDPALGSRLFQLVPSPHMEQQATAYVEEALRSLPEISVAEVQCQQLDPEGVALRIKLQIKNNLYPLEVITHV